MPDLTITQLRETLHLSIHMATKDMDYPVQRSWRADAAALIDPAAEAALYWQAALVELGIKGKGPDGAITLNIERTAETVDNLDAAAHEVHRITGLVKADALFAIQPHHARVIEKLGRVRAFAASLVATLTQKEEE